MQIIFIITHPIQYQAPLYRYLAAQGLAMQVWFCSQTPGLGGHDAEFGQTIAWDIPLTEGYPHRFFENKGKTTGTKRGFWAYANPDMVVALKAEPKSLVIVHGWSYATYVTLLRYGRRLGHVVAFRGEVNAAMEARLPRLKRWLRRQYHRWVLAHVSWFLYIGKQSQAFYQQLGVPAEQMAFTPYAVDNQRFSETLAQLGRQGARQQLGLAEEGFYWLWVGKYIAKKCPLEMLEAFARINQPQARLIMVGEGPLRPQMEAAITRLHLGQRVQLTGFVNQQQIPLYYTAAHAYVMNSTWGETWGLAVNEAMAAALPVIVSDRCGCAADLVLQGNNGTVSQAQNIASLAQAMQQMADMPADRLAAMGQASLDIIEGYHFKPIYKTLAAISGQH